MSEAIKPLLPCPFCGAGETHLHINKGVWNGQRYGEPVSVEVRHWCDQKPGQPSRMIALAGRDEASAIAAWTRRSDALVERVKELEAVLLGARNELYSLINTHNRQDAHDGSWLYDWQTVVEIDAALSKATPNTAAEAKP